jgi:hypothetical protein
VRGGQHEHGPVDEPAVVVPQEVEQVLVPAVEHLQQMCAHGRRVVGFHVGGHLPVLWSAEGDVDADVAGAVSKHCGGPGSVAAGPLIDVSGA